MAALRDPIQDLLRSLARSKKGVSRAARRPRGRTVQTRTSVPNASHSDLAGLIHLGSNRPKLSSLSIVSRWWRGLVELGPTEDLSPVCREQQSVDSIDVFCMADVVAVLALLTST